MKSWGTVTRLMGGGRDWRDEEQFSDKKLGHGGGTRHTQWPWAKGTFGAR